MSSRLCKAFVRQPPVRVNLRRRIRPPVGVRRLPGGCLVNEGNDVPNVTVVSERRVCVSLTRSRHPSFNGDCAFKSRHIYRFGSVMD
jgi:hypothetical protein